MNHEEIAARVAQDTQPADEPVLVPKGRDTGSAQLYHDLEADCRHLKITGKEPRQMSRAAAQARGKAPCATCHPEVEA